MTVIVPDDGKPVVEATVIAPVGRTTPLEAAAIVVAGMVVMRPISALVFIGWTEGGQSVTFWPAAKRTPSPGWTVKEVPAVPGLLVRVEYPKSEWDQSLPWKGRGGVASIIRGLLGSGGLALRRLR